MKKEEIPTLALPTAEWLSWQNWGEMARLAPTGACPLLQALHLTLHGKASRQESSSLSRRNLVKSSRQHYAPAPWRSGFGGLCYIGSHGTWIPFAMWCQESVQRSPRCPSEGEGQTGPFCSLDCTKEAWCASKKPCSWDVALNISNQITKACIISQSSLRVMPEFQEFCCPFLHMLTRTSYLPQFYRVFTSHIPFTPAVYQTPTML